MKTRTHITQKQKAIQERTFSKQEQIILSPMFFKFLLITFFSLLISLYFIDSIFTHIILMILSCLILVSGVHQYINFIETLCFKKTRTQSHQSDINLYNHHNYFQDTKNIHDFKSYKYGMDKIGLSVLIGVMVLTSWAHFGFYGIVQWTMTILINIAVVYFLIRHNSLGKIKTYYSVKLKWKKYHVQKDKIFFY